VDGLITMGADARTSRRALRPLVFLRQLSGRTPLRTKIITLLFGLVAVALMVIGFVTVVVFSGYLQDQADTQVTALYQQVTNNGPYGGHFRAFTGTADVVELITTSGQLIGGGTGSPSLPGPVIPTSQSWLTANAGHIVTVPAATGNYNWRVIVQQATLNNLEPGILVVGVNLGNIDQTIGYLTRLDAIVSGAILLVLVVVGAAVVRANLRPLNDIEITAGEIARGHLNHRVPERDPRTEVGSLGRSLNTMLSQIETAFHAQEQSERAAHQSEERMRRFIADASHELRTPLTTIRGFAEYYRQRGGIASGTEGGFPGAANGSSRHGLAPKDLDRIMHRLEAEASRMGVLVEDLLLLARLDQQRPLNRQPVDLLTLAADSVQDARMVAHGRPIDLIVAPGAAYLVEGDEARLRQVIGNLMNNALAHTPPGTPVRVRISSGTLTPPSAPSPDRPSADAHEPVPAVVLDMEDDGPGMTPEQAQRVFERFYRVDKARSRTSGGTGLGLSIVASLVAAHGGTVSVRTAPGKGADFQVKLPLSPEAQGYDEDLDSVEPPV
jgi:two-component system, OmpR family, sensor kinase